MDKVLRVAYFADSFLEVNGVATTSKKLVNFAERRDYPFMYVFAGDKTEIIRSKNLVALSLKRSLLAIPMDMGLKYDPLFQRHVGRVRKELMRFKPDVIHVSGVNDVSIIGSYLAKRLDIPMVGSWHTNLHEYASLRLERKLRFLPNRSRRGLQRFVERRIFDGAKLYYRMPHVILAPNQELIDKLSKGTGRSTRLMMRGVDTDTYSPKKRTVSDGIFRLGFVGRLRSEKNVKILPEIEKQLIETGKTQFKFLIVGEGSEREFLEANMTRAEFTGFLAGEQLSEAYANMDVFVFPSETETFGNVVQEANASGVPCIVTDHGGPKFTVRDGETGFVAKNVEDFVSLITRTMDDPEMLASMKDRAREFAMTRSWDSVFEGVYEAYQEAKDFLESTK